MLRAATAPVSTVCTHRPPTLHHAHTHAWTHREPHRMLQADTPPRFAPPRDHAHTHTLPPHLAVVNVLALRVSADWEEEEEGKQALAASHPSPIVARTATAHR